MDEIHGERIFDRDHQRISHLHQRQRPIPGCGTGAQQFQRQRIDAEFTHVYERNAELVGQRHVYLPHRDNPHIDEDVAEMAPAVRRLESEGLGQLLRRDEARLQQQLAELHCGAAFCDSSARLSSSGETIPRSKRCWPNFS